jgi:uncharacterized membrane protein YwzB
LLLVYLLTVVLRPEGYNPSVYRDTYRYFMVFDFILFSLFIPFWSAGGLETGGIASFLKLLAGITVMAMSSVPLVLTIFMTARLSPFNFLLPLLMKPVWGLAVISLKSFLGTLKPGWRWSTLALALFIFATLALGCLLAFFFVEYRQAVVTTLYDQDIPAVFFLNPLLSLAGLVNSQTGGGSQMGFAPFYACALCWLLVATALGFGAFRLSSHRGRQAFHE